MSSALWAKTAVKYIHTIPLVKNTHLILPHHHLIAEVAYLDGARERYSDISI
jgi:hypothetical protein